jgi:serine protease AprX
MRKVSLVLLAAAMACFAGGPKHKISSDLSATRSSSVQIIVQWGVSSGSAISEKVLALGGAVISEFPRIRAGVYQLPSSALTALGEDQDLKFISADRKIRKKSDVKAPVNSAIKAAPAAAVINAPYAWYAGYLGRGIGVAVVDSGINQDDDLGIYLNAPVYTEDFTGLMPARSGKNSSKLGGYGPDWYGHGQHIAGIIGSNGKSSLCSNCTQSFLGIAPAASLINLKVLNANGVGSDSSVMAAIDRAIALKNSYNIRVMNLSLGRPVYESYTQDPLCQAVEAAWQAGIVVVVSAGNNGRDSSLGNDGYGTINAPGNDPYVITVGAMKDMGTADGADDFIASYSSKGPTAIDHIVKPDVVAPGNLIVSLLAQNGTLALDNPENITAIAAYQSNAPRVGSIPVQPDYDATAETQPPAVKVGAGYSKRYYTMSGTSMAAAVVSGAVADLLQATPGLTPDQVKMLLMQTASKTFPTSSTVVDPVTAQSYTSYYDIFTVGAGYVDLMAALRSADQVPTGVTAISPTAVYDSTSGEVELSFDSTSVFSDKAMWGAGSTSANKAMWGAGSTSANKAMWGASSMWSNSVLNGNKAMWGASSVWGASVDSAEKAMWGASAIWTNKAMWGASSMTVSESLIAHGEQ